MPHKMLITLKVALKIILKTCDKFSHILGHIFVKFLANNFEGKDKMSEQGN